MDELKEINIVSEPDFKRPSIPPINFQKEVDESNTQTNTTINKHDSPFTAMVREAVKNKPVHKETKNSKTLRRIKSHVDRLLTRNTKRRDSLDIISPRDVMIREDSPQTAILEESRLEIEDNGPWTSEMEEQVVRFAAVCSDDYKQAMKISKNNEKWNTIFQVITILAGAAGVYVVSIDIDSEIKNILASIFAALSSICVGISGILDFSKKSTIANQSATILQEIARKLRYQILKPEEQRQDPLTLLLEVEKKRDKVMTQIT